MIKSEVRATLGTVFEEKKALTSLPLSSVFKVITQKKSATDL